MSVLATSFAFLPNVAFHFGHSQSGISCKSLSDQNSNHKKPEYKAVVLTTFTVLADISSNISGDRLLVQSITKPGVEIHGYQPTPSDLVRASKAQLFLENGLGLELWAEKFMSSIENVPRVVLSKGMKPLFIEGDAYHGKPNPQVWMSPKRAIYYVDNIVKAFTAIDPEGKEIYKDDIGLLIIKHIESNFI